MFNFRIDMPIYTTTDDIEVSKIVDFRNVLEKLGLKKFIEPAYFTKIIK
jgi:hypothetical protein